MLSTASSDDAASQQALLTVPTARAPELVGGGTNIEFGEVLSRYGVASNSEQSRGRPARISERVYPLRHQGVRGPIDEGVGSNRGFRQPDEQVDQRIFRTPFTDRRERRSCRP